MRQAVASAAAGRVSRGVRAASENAGRPLERRDTNETEKIGGEENKLMQNEGEEGRGE
jgi:hypothetical protein